MRKHFVVVEGEKLTVQQAAEVLGVGESTLFQRIGRGDTPEEAGRPKNKRLARKNKIKPATSFSEYGVWASMITRCCNSKHPTFKNYGGRGITVCDEWKNDFFQFFRDMGPRPEGYQIDRIDNDGNYEPTNCCWSTASENARNKSTNNLVDWYGKTYTMVELAEKFNIPVTIVNSRLQKNWGLKKALTTPVIKRGAYSGSRRVVIVNGRKMTALKASEILGISRMTIYQRLGNGDTPIEAGRPKRMNLKKFRATQKQQKRADKALRAIIPSAFFI